MLTVVLSLVEELATAAKMTLDPGEKDASFLERIAVAVAALPDDEWEKISPSAQLVANEVIACLNEKRPLPGIQRDGDAPAAPEVVTAPVAEKPKKEKKKDKKEKKAAVPTEAELAESRAKDEPTKPQVSVEAVTHNQSTTPKSAHYSLNKYLKDDSLPETAFQTSRPLDIIRFIMLHPLTSTAKTVYDEYCKANGGSPVADRYFSRMVRTTRKYVMVMKTLQKQGKGPFTHAK